MKKKSEFEALIQKIENSNQEVTITSLRSDILKIIFSSAVPLTAYAILDALRKERHSAEPPTVYRVMDYFVEKKIIHKIDSDNTYVICANIEDDFEQSHGVLFICSNCNASLEVHDKKFIRMLESLAEHHFFHTDCAVIQVKGKCNACVAHST